MCGCCSRMDWDSLLAYQTVKMVRVRDRYLGIIRVITLFLIFLYIVGKVLVLDRSYQDCVSPRGSIELSLREPLNTTIYPSNYSYCSQYKGKNIGIPVLECEVVDYQDVYNPVDQTDAMFIATRYNQLEEIKACTNNSLPCANAWTTYENSSINSEPYYSAAIEDFTIKFSHFFQARKFYIKKQNPKYSQSCNTMSGKLVDIHDNTIMEYGKDNTDIMPISLILKAANVNLDDFSDAPNSNNESMRHSGIALFFAIDYSNEYSKEVKYTYQIIKVPKIEYKVVTSTFIENNIRLTTNKHGIKIFFIYSGAICKFDFQLLLIQLVSGMALLSLGTIITDVLMVYCMPARHAYAYYKYEQTENRSNMIQKSKKGNIKPNKTIIGVGHGNRNVSEIDYERLSGTSDDNY